jgi:hypothetical protein
MSQYLSFELVNKKNPDIKVDLGYWCTSIARGISWNFEDIFRYTGDEDVELDIETMKSYIETLHDGVEEYKENLRKQQKSKQENTELLLRAQTEVVVKAIQESIDMNDDSIADWEEEIDIWSSVESKLRFILNILEENGEEWKLMYNNS